MAKSNLKKAIDCEKKLDGIDAVLHMDGNMTERRDFILGNLL